MINTRQFVANQQIKTGFATNGIILIIIHRKISINLFINSQKNLLQCSYIINNINNKMRYSLNNKEYTTVVYF